MLVVLTSFFFSRGVNGFLGLTPLPRLFPGYEAAAGEIYSCSLVSQVMASVITAPILEELLMRESFTGGSGVFFRTKDMRL